MKVTAYYNLDDFRVEERAMPVLEAGEALIKIHACGLCGTDIHKAVHQTVEQGTVLGHEIGGEIIALGAGVEDFRVGDRVFVAHHVPCFTCRDCQSGHHTVCKQWKATHVDPGGFAEYIRLSALHVKHTMLKLPQSMNYEQAAMMEPTACALRAIKRAGIRAGDHVMVMGSGQVGNILIQLAKAYRAGLVIANDVSDFRLEMAQRLGANYTINSLTDDLYQFVMTHTQGRGLDVVIIAAAVPSLFDVALRCVAKGGTILSFAVFEAGVQVSFEANQIGMHEVDLIGSYSSTPFEYLETLELIDQRVVDVDHMITHRFPMNELGRAVQTALNPKTNCLKVMMTPFEDTYGGQRHD